MPQTEEEYRLVVEQKMLARATRNAQQHQAALAEEAQAATQARATQARTEQDRQKQVAERNLHEIAMQARRQRPALLAQYKHAPAGMRAVEVLRRVCLACGSDWVQTKTTTHAQQRLQCNECRAEWMMGRCWNCTTGRLDSRDPETPMCKVCRRNKCADCGACNINGCSTNPYHASFRQRDEQAAQALADAPPVS